MNTTFDIRKIEQKYINIIKKLVEKLKKKKEFFRKK